MSVWHFYALETGVFTGRRIDCPDDHVQANTPAGCGAVQGVDDWQAQCVDLQTGQVIDWQPPAPPSDAMQTWTWSAPTRRWTAAPTLAALRLQAWRRIKAERSKREFGAFTWSNSVFDANEASQRRIAAAAAAAARNPLQGARTWTLADNSTRQMSAADMIALDQALAANVDALHATARQLRAQINAATTQAQLDAIQWPA